MKKLIFIIGIPLVVLGFAYYYHNQVKDVVTLKILGEDDTASIINTLNVSLGDIVLLEEHSFERRGNRGTVIRPLGNAVVHYSYPFGISTYYRMITKKEEAKFKPVKIEWVMKGTPSDSLIKSNTIEYSYPSLLETISIKKGVVVKSGQKGGLS